MIKELFAEFISLSDKMRLGYKDSLGTTYQAWERIIGAMNQYTPELFREIYGRFAGTYRNIQDQKYMDFIPGYRLIHITELKSECNILAHLIKADDICNSRVNVIMPLLADYSSCYICYVKKLDNTEAIFSYSPDGGLVEIHSTLEIFFETIITFYKENVYFLDDNGFLDYDFEKAGVVGKRCNPGVLYWAE